MLARVGAIADPNEVGDSAYATSLRAAVSAAVGYGFAAVDIGGGRAAELPIPVELPAQARTAVRNGVSLETVLRRYSAGNSLFSCFLLEEASRIGTFPSAELRHLAGGQAALLDRLLASVAESYRKEAASRPSSEEARRVERIERLLAGELIDPPGLAYDFDAVHQAAIATGAGAKGAVQRMAVELDRRLLLVQRDEEMVWAWLAGRRAIGTGELERHLIGSWPAGCALALGEPASGLAGWRLSHRQARAALPIVRSRAGRQARYADVALLASMLRDDLLIESLRRIYLAPLERDRDGGATARETLRAYFASGRSISSAAALLGVNRHTVASRLRAIEGRIGRELPLCAADLEASLQLDELAGPGQAGAFCGPHPDTLGRRAVSVAREAWPTGN